MNEKQAMILVPENWFKTLLETAERFEEENKNWEFGQNAANDKVHFEAVSLMGYAKSASFILKNNKRIEDYEK